MVVDKEVLARAQIHAQDSATTSSWWHGNSTRAEWMTTATTSSS